jgi:ribonuclease E
MRLWDNIRELTLQSSAPSVINEEGNLIKRSIRDIYDAEVEEVLVAGEEGFKFAKDFMKMMIPSHAKRVQEYTDEQIPLFNRYQVENQISDMSEPSVTLPSGGYIVINPTEALVSVDVNSGRATRERHIEETALTTNLEAATEVARQLRLRDLGGLVVIDFIDMEDRRNNFKVERRLKDALSSDRARIQVGRISSFGLLELSRQRLNPSLTEAQFEKCSHCKGTGFIRTVDATAISALRALEEEGIRERADQVILEVPNRVALYILNNKRAMLADIERRYGFSVLIGVNEELAPSGFKTEPVKHARDEDEDEGEEGGQREPRESRGRGRDRNDRGDRNNRDRNRGRDRDEGERHQHSHRHHDDEQPETGDEGGNEQRGERSESQGEGRGENGERTGRRRRGRRGGRNRNRNRDGNGENRFGNEGGEGNEEGFSPEASDEAAEEFAQDHSFEATNEGGNEAQGEESAAGEGRSQNRRGGRGGRGRGRGRERNDGNVAEASPFDGDSGNAASNDDSFVAPGSALEVQPQPRRQRDTSENEARRAEFETLNPETGENKKGWWNKLTN